LLETRGQEARRQRFAFWSGVARLAAIPLAMLLAVPLLLGFLRTAGGGARATLGLVLGLLYFIAQRIVESGTLAFALEPSLLAWLPVMLLAVAVAVLLWRARRLSVA
jgi:lipopolysaccharide export LptBFGC system permease protein LptF